MPSAVKVKASSSGTQSTLPKALRYIGGYEVMLSLVERKATNTITQTTEYTDTATKPALTSTREFQKL